MNALLTISLPGCAGLCWAVPGCAWLCRAVPVCAWLRLAAQGDHPGAVLVGFPLPGSLEVVFGYTQGIPSPQKNLPTVFRLGWGPGVLAAITKIAVLRVAFQGVAA